VKVNSSVDFWGLGHSDFLMAKATDN
jgi:hypothetical protein